MSHRGTVLCPYACRRFQNRDAPIANVRQSRCPLEALRRQTLPPDWPGCVEQRTFLSRKACSIRVLLFAATALRVQYNANFVGVVWGQSIQPLTAGEMSVFKSS